jgi:hypothetical protein
MAGPLSGLGQQIPLATTFQPGVSSNGQVRTEDKKPQDNVTQPRKAASAQSNRTEVVHNRDSSSRPLRVSASNDDGTPKGRGSLLDISV